MRKWLLILLIASFGLSSSGCITYIVLRHRPSTTPAHCYDCHGHPGWIKVYASCNYYKIKTDGGGYYYKPRNVKHAKFVYRTYDRKLARERQVKHIEFMKSHKQTKSKKHDDRKDKEKKPRRG
ncbi:MAG: hypothetical protein GY839_03380 [candidate division Zixibacteria bacterium]|nr:hypothetical protein [candidate division Zixibacteria bacterium]